MSQQQPPTPVEMENTAANSIVNEILLGQRQNMTKSFPHILGGGKEKYGGLCHKPPPNMAPQKYDTNICKINKKYIENSKYWRTGTGIGCSGTTNPGATRKPDNPFKGLWD